MLLGKGSLPFGLALLALILSTCLRTVLSAGTSSSQKTPESNKNWSMEPGESSTSHEKTCQSLFFDLRKTHMIKGTALECHLSCMLEFYVYTLDLNDPTMKVYPGSYPIEKERCLVTGSTVCATLYASIVEVPNENDMKREIALRRKGKAPLDPEVHTPSKTNKGVLPALAEASEGQILQLLAETATVCGELLTLYSTNKASTSTPQKGNLPKKTLLLTFAKAGFAACKALVNTVNSSSTKNKGKSKNEIKDKDKDKGKQKTEDGEKKKSMICTCTGKLTYSLAHTGVHRGQTCDVQNIHDRLKIRDWNVIPRFKDNQMGLSCKVKENPFDCDCLNVVNIALGMYKMGTALWCLQWTVPKRGDVARAKITDALQSGLPKLERDKVCNEIARYHYFK